MLDLSDARRKQTREQKLDALKCCELYNTPEIEPIKQDAKTDSYIVWCVGKMYVGDYGDIDDDARKANENALTRTSGFLCARYKKAYQLQHDIIIETMFDWRDAANPDKNFMLIKYATDNF